jgi:hypothetical protein
MRRFVPTALAVLSASGAAFAQAKPQAKPAPPVAPVAAQPAAQPVARAAKSVAADREETAITVYNQNFGLVREVRNIDLGTGRVALELRDVAAQIQPETVHIKSLAGANALTVREQNYRYDLLSPQKLLEKYVGRRVKVNRWNEKLGKDEELDAEVLSVAEGTVLKIGNEITFNFPGRISFPEVPENLISKPTLVWLLDSNAQKQKVEVTYLTHGMTWKSDYVFVLDDTDTHGDLQGWVTLNNTSGAAYQNARLKLVAGDVQRVTTTTMLPTGAAYPTSPAAGEAQFKEEGFFEYHLYTLERPTTLLENEQKQVTLLESQGIGVAKHLVFFGGSQWYQSRYGELGKNQKVGVYLEIQNSERNKLGMPLPKGIVRVYKADKSGAKQFIGEDNIDHTPRDETFKIKMGEAFDVVADRTQTDWKTLGRCGAESAWEIAVRNHKDTPVEVELIEPVGGDWEIVQSSLQPQKKDAHTFVFKPQIKARGDVKVTYRVRIRWC